MTRIFLKSGRVNTYIHVLTHIISVDALRTSQKFFSHGDTFPAEDDLWSVFINGAAQCHS